MPFSIDRTEGRAVLKLEGAISVRHARELATELRNLAADGNPLTIDTAGLAEIDTCILQVLCSLRKSLPTASFDSPSSVFTEAAGRRGLRRELGGAREIS